MDQQYYSVDQVAELLDLHVKTVRAYIRDGRLRATRIGKQYRVRRQDLEEFTGGPLPGPEAPEAAGGGRTAEASTVVRVDGIGPDDASRLTNLISASLAGAPGGAARVHVQTVHDPARASLKVVVLGDLAGTAAVLELIGLLVDEERE
ncbi:helix-turn-helix domain-containing protein [Nocardiopsis sp. CT-R113]|uniref:Helix-turn-helix domain-containing protein n=1 Tax=Nocardiopsis codii TaxID=3065942 RepID=A0ABU7K422_9ACTN|nr:helix-turn-helix domain-containing protein [Nocardiopsis sp. CT-R113]MEE2037006.1 helix-turn-helix domain-containing protein [Nocardiopsis sp. CT-R113]